MWSDSFLEGAHHGLDELNEKVLSVSVLLSHSILPLVILGEPVLLHV